MFQFLKLTFFIYYFFRRKSDESPSKRRKRKENEEDSDDEKSKKREKRAAANAATVAIGEMDHVGFGIFGKIEIFEPSKLYSERVNFDGTCLLYSGQSRMKIRIFYWNS